MRPLGAKRRKLITDKQMVRPTGQVSRKFTKPPPVVGSLQGTTYGGTRWPQQDSHKWARYRIGDVTLRVDPVRSCTSCLSTISILLYACHCALLHWFQWAVECPLTATWLNQLASNTAHTNSRTVITQTGNVCQSTFRLNRGQLCKTRCRVYAGYAALANQRYIFDISIQYVY